jgi:hypothetical protein
VRGGFWIRQPAFGSSTDEISYTTDGIYKIAPPKEYRHEGKIASAKYNGRLT